MTGSRVESTMYTLTHRASVILQFRNLQLSFVHYRIVFRLRLSPFLSSRLFYFSPASPDKPIEVLPVQFFPAGGRGVLHGAEDFLLDVGGQIRGGVLADLELAFQVLLDVAEPFGEHFSLPQGVLVAAGLHVALDLGHDLDHLLQVGVMEVGHLELQVDALGLVAQLGLLAGEAFGAAAAGIAGRRALRALRPPCRSPCRRRWRRRPTACCGP